MCYYGNLLMRGPQRWVSIFSLLIKTKTSTKLCIDHQLVNRDPRFNYYWGKIIAQCLCHAEDIFLINNCSICII